MNSKNIYMTLWTKQMYPFNVYIYIYAIIFYSKQLTRDEQKHSTV